MKLNLVIESLDLVGVQVLAERLVRWMPRRLTIGLVGTLGAGKTTLVQAISRAVGVDVADVTSPTFTLLQSHRSGDQTLHHLDAYRVADEDEFVELGVEELFDDEQAWTLVEWADRVAGVMPPETLWLEMRIDQQPGLRTVEFRTSDRGLADVLETALREMIPSG